MGPKTSSRSVLDGSPRVELRCTVSVTETPDGALAATIELHGELCASTAPQLRDQIGRLIDDGVSRLVIDLADLQLCTSHGLDAFDQAHRHLGDDGAVRILNASGIVARVLSTVEDADPTFPPLRRAASA